MKKFMQILTSALMLTATMAFVSGCSNQTSGAVEQQFSAVSSDVAEINIAVKDRAIEILPSSDGEIHITYFESDKEFYEIAVNENKVLTMQSASDKELSDYFGLSDDSVRSILLEVPNPLPCNLVISSTKNDIVLPEIVVEGGVDIQMNDGAIALDHITVQGDISLNAKNGNISGSLIGSYEDYSIQANAHKGDSNLPEHKAEGTNALTVNTNNGDIDIEFIDRA